MFISIKSEGLMLGSTKMVKFAPDGVRESEIMKKICFAALPNPWFIVGLWFEQQTSCAALENLFNIDDTHLRDSSELTLKDRHTGWRVFWLSEQGKSEKEWQCQRLLCIINHSNVTSSLLRMIHPWWLRWFCWCWKRDKSGTSEHCSLPAH